MNRFTTIRTVNGRPTPMRPVDADTLAKWPALDAEDRAKVNAFIEIANPGDILQTEWRVIVCLGSDYTIQYSEVEQ